MLSDRSSCRRVMVALVPGQSSLITGNEYAAKFPLAELRLAKPGVGQQFSLWFPNSDEGDAQADDAVQALKVDGRVHRVEDTIRWYANPRD